MATKEFHELMGIVKYGCDQDKAILLMALLQEKKRRQSKVKPRK